MMMRLPSCSSLRPERSASRFSTFALLLLCTSSAILSLSVVSATFHESTRTAPSGCTNTAASAASTTANTVGIPQTDVSIDAVTVLLPAHVVTPYRTFVVYYPVSAHGGCFQWRTSHPSLIQIQPMAHTRCTEKVSVRNAAGHIELVEREGHTSVYVSAATEAVADGIGAVQPGAPFTSNASFQRRLAAWISAHDITREERYAECEIFIDTIDRLEILTSTRRINVGDIEALQLQAYDSMNNVFSSLDGLPFEWMTNNDGATTTKASSDNKILKEITLSESGLVVPASLWELEHTGFHTNIQPVRGIIPGRINMTAKLSDTKHPVLTQVELLVIEPLYLKPAQARLAPGSELRIQLLTRWKEGSHTMIDDADEEEEISNKTKSATTTSTSTTPTTISSSAAVHRREISMPSSQYKWSTLDPVIASIDRDTGLLVARSTGSTRVRVGDLNLPEHKGESDVVVVEPARIELELRPIHSTTAASVVGPHHAASSRRITCDSMYFIEEGSQYELLIYLLDSTGYKMAITPNMAFGFSTQGNSILRANRPDTPPSSPLPNEAGSAAASGAGGSATRRILPDSSSIHLLAAKKGLTSISVSLASIVSRTSGIEYVLQRNGVATPLTQQIRIQVTPAIEITTGLEAPIVRKIYYLPLISPFLPRYPIAAIGGSGMFKWSSDASSSTNPNGMVNIITGRNTSAIVDLQATSAGRALVIASDACNPEAHGRLEVHVTSPGSLSFITNSMTKREAVVDSLSEHSIIDVHIKLDTPAGLPVFDDCSSLYLHASFEKGAGNFQTLESIKNDTTSVYQCYTSTTECGEAVGPAKGDASSSPSQVKRNCFHLRLRAVKAGMSMLRVNLLDSPSSHGVPLSSPVFAHYNAFSTLITEPSPLILAQGSSQLIQYLNGPSAFESLPHNSEVDVFFTQTWLNHAAYGVLDREQLIRADWLKHDLTSDGYLSVKRIVDPNQKANNIYELGCIRIGEPIALHVVVSNKVSDSLPNPLASHNVIRVHCFPPIKLKEEPKTLGIGESKPLILEDTTHPLAHLVRFFSTHYDASTSSDAFRVDRQTGVVTGIRLGQGYIHAIVDRSALLVELGYSATTRQPQYRHDGLEYRHLIKVEFDAFRIVLSAPLYPSQATLVRDSASLATIYGSAANREGGPDPLDESFEHVQCAWTVEKIGATGTPGLAMAPSLSFANGLIQNALPGEDSIDAAPTVIYGCAIRLLALKPGSHTLKAHITVSPPSARGSPSDPSATGQQALFTASLAITVIEPLLLLSPSSLILPPSSTANIITNIQSQNTTKVVYTILSYSCHVLIGGSQSTKNSDTKPAVITASHTPFITVDSRGLITVRARVEGESDYSAADAVVLVQSWHTSLGVPSASSSDPTDLVSPVTQTRTVLVQMRPLAQISVLGSGSSTGSTSIPQLLCPSRNYSLSLTGLDSLGRRFDVARLDDLLASVQVNASSTSRGELPVSVVRVAAVSVNVVNIGGASAAAGAAIDSHGHLTHQLLSTYILHVGDSLDGSPDTHHTLHALQDFTLQFRMPSLPSSSTAAAAPTSHSLSLRIPPVYLQFYVAPTNLCSEPSPVMVSLKLSIPVATWTKEYPSHSVQRDTFLSALTSEIASILHVHVRRIRVVNIDVSNGLCELVILPKSHASDLHKDQWFMSYFTPSMVNGTRTMTATATVSASTPPQTYESWLSSPFLLAQQLQQQALNQSSSLWVGSVGKLIRQIDSKQPFVSQELTHNEAERLVQERRGTSSSLTSGSIGSSSTSTSVAQSPWSDERELASWSRVKLMDSAIGGRLARLELASDMKKDHTVERGGEGANTEGSSTTDGSQATPVAPQSEQSRREEEESKWKELKRRYELEKLRESAPIEPASLWSSLPISLLLTLLTLGLLFSYAYWYTFIAAMQSTSSLAQQRRLNIPSEQRRRMPEYNYLVWMFQKLQDLLWCGGRRGSNQPTGFAGVASGLIDPQLLQRGLGGAIGSPGPSSKQWQQQAKYEQVPPAQVYLPPQPIDDFQHIQHSWERS